MLETDCALLFRLISQTLLSLPLIFSVRIKNISTLLIFWMMFYFKYWKHFFHYFDWVCINQPYHWVATGFLNEVAKRWIWWKCHSAKTTTQFAFVCSSQPNKRENIHQTKPNTFQYTGNGKRQELTCTKNFVFGWIIHVPMCSRSVQSCHFRS